MLSKLKALLSDLLLFLVFRFQNPVAVVVGFRFSDVEALLSDLFSFCVHFLNGSAPSGLQRQPLRPQPRRRFAGVAEPFSVFERGSLLTLRVKAVCWPAIFFI